MLLHSVDGFLRIVVDLHSFSPTTVSRPPAGLLTVARNQSLMVQGKIYAVGPEEFYRAHAPRRKQVQARWRQSVQGLLILSPAGGAGRKRSLFSVSCASYLPGVPSAECHVPAALPVAAHRSARDHHCDAPWVPLCTLLGCTVRQRGVIAVCLRAVCALLNLPELLRQAYFSGKPPRQTTGSSSSRRCTSLFLFQFSSRSTPTSSTSPSGPQRWCAAARERLPASHEYIRDC